jgi:hypothetical protein
MRLSSHDGIMLVAESKDPQGVARIAKQEREERGMYVRVSKLESSPELDTVHPSMPAVEPPSSYFPDSLWNKNSRKFAQPRSYAERSLMYRIGSFVAWCT